MTPRAPWVGAEFYAAGRRLADEGLGSDGSLFTPGRTIWTSAVIAELEPALAVVDTSSRGFGDKLHEQLRLLAPAAIQLAAEFLYVAMLGEGDTGAAKKREHVEGVLSLLPEPVQIPDDLAAALAYGIATYGQGGRNRRDAFLRYLGSFVEAWKALGVETHADLLADPWRFREFAHSVPDRGGRTQREALLHVLFPDVFEPIVSVAVKENIAQAFAAYGDGSATDVDARLASIRSALEDERGGDFSFYDDDLRAGWEADGTSARRAWLIRGANDHGVNRIPAWLGEGYVSIGWSDSEHAQPGMSVAELQDALRRGGLGDSHVRRGAGNLHRFFNQMAVGDLVLTLEGSRVFLGRLADVAERRGEAEDGAFWRRRTDWLNPEIPLDRHDLPEALQKSLKTLMTLTDLTKHLELVEALVPEDSDSWGEFLHWAGRLYEHPSFDEEERNYKLEVARKLAHARERLDEADWLDALRDALGPPNNMTHWQYENMPFLQWCEAEPAAAREFLRSLWGPDEDAVLRGNAFAVPTEVLHGRAARVAMSSLLLLARDASRYPAFRHSAYEKACGLVGRPVVDRSAGVAALYGDFVAFLDEVRGRIAATGVELRDRLDAQGVVWWLGTAQGPPDDWSDEDRRAYSLFVGLAESLPRLRTPGQTVVPTPTQGLADRLLLPQEWLAEIVDLLNEKRQVIFYGPPGTGKTFVAQALGEHVKASGGEWRLVQFHPAYSYEDFFEGYRPTGGGAEGLAFELRPGPLRAIADEARAHSDKPYLLVIDELNRGNVAKIFGELFFLLEYRDRAIRLQYRPQEEFRLPDNLFVIGTMNTADRSIALVDSALRRRFYFVGFLPREWPVDELLTKWLDAKSLDREPAALLARLNRIILQMLGDDDFAIGPSYFMTRTGHAPNLGRIWKHAIMPLLEERFHGARRPDELERELGLDAVRRAGSGAELAPKEESPTE